MDRITCPYCGGIMEHCHPCEDGFAFECIDCGAMSPVSDTFDSAIANALSRPMQKPLTLEEVKSQISVWIEMLEKCNSTSYIIEPALCVCFDLHTVCFDEGFSKQFRLPKGDYGIKWRCWATKPTDEERKAAKWEE